MEAEENHIDKIHTAIFDLTKKSRNQRHQESIMFNRINETEDPNSIKRNNEKKCCDSSEPRFIATHGIIQDPQDFFELKEGYTVIFLAKYGQCIWTSEPKREAIKKLYKDGHSIFQDNDTKTALTEEALLMFGRFNNYGSPELFIGGINTIFDVGRPIKVPNVQLYFGGTACDRGTTSLVTSTTPVKIYPNCYLQCINKENRCEKYYFSKEFDSNDDNPDEKDRKQQLEFSKSAINTENMQGISLQTLLENEGPGKYIIMCCLETPDKKSELLYNFMSKLQRIEKGPPSTRTRNAKRELEDNIKAIEDQEGGTPKKVRKTKKQKNKKSKKNKKTKKQKNKKTKKQKNKKTKKTKKAKKAKKTKAKKT